MENNFAELAQALRERLAVIRDEESRRDEAKHIARLRAVSEKIDKLQQALPQPVDPRLAHYLQRRSYDKALEFLVNFKLRSPRRAPFRSSRPLTRRWDPYESGN
jgi:hypothetical protein